MRDETGCGFTGTGPRGFGVNVDEGIEKRLDFRDARKMAFDKFDRREFSAAEVFECFGDGKVVNRSHRGEQRKVAVPQGFVKARGKRGTAL